MSQRENPVIKRASTDVPMETFLSELGKVNRCKGLAVQAFDPRIVVSRMHLNWAYANSIAAFKNGSNISKSLAMEMLLFAAMTTQITDAIKLAGAKSNNDFVIFANSHASFRKIKGFLSSSTTFTSGEKERRAAAAKLGIHAKVGVDKFALQRMAVSRLGD